MEPVGEISLKIGDRVRIITVPPELPDGGDLKTNFVFERCLGRVFPVVGFQGDWLELEVGEAMGQPSYMHTIWIEPRFVQLVE